MCMEEAGEHPVSRAGSNPQARTTGQLCTLLGSSSHQMSCLPPRDISVVQFLYFYPDTNNQVLEKLHEESTMFCFKGA